MLRGWLTWPQATTGEPAGSAGPDPVKVSAGAVAPDRSVDGPPGPTTVISETPVEILDREVGPDAPRASACSPPPRPRGFPCAPSWPSTA